MATWTKIERPTEDGTIVSMQAPLIVSASRSTGKLFGLTYKQISVVFNLWKQVRERLCTEEFKETEGQVPVPLVIRKG